MEVAQEKNSEYVLDIKKLERLVSDHQQEDLKFAQFLKTQDPTEIDQIVLEISRNVAVGVDCQSCANCCKSLSVGLNYMDITRLAEHLGISNGDFKKKYMKKDQDGDLVIRQHPCPFLKSNSCSVYNCRPGVCRSYPHFEKGHFVDQLGKVMIQLPICPIVYNTWELLKLKFQ